MNYSKNKKAQIAIWFIIAFVIVAIILIFFFVQRKAVLEKPQEFNPKSYIDLCAKKAVEKVVDNMMLTGGIIEPQNYKIYKDTKVPYICENRNYYLPCINQHPMLLEEYKREILNYSKPGIEECFQGLKDEVEKRNGNVVYSPLIFDLALSPGIISLNIERKTSITSNGEKIEVDNFDSQIRSSLYDITNVVIDIAAGEAKNCNFEYVTYMILYKKWDITKFVMSDSTKIYTIKDMDSQKETMIAIRGCAIPAGS